MVNYWYQMVVYMISSGKWSLLYIDIKYSDIEV